jgi:two-component system LytT family response regulator
MSKNSVKVIVVDDEQLAIDVLEEYLRDHTEFEIIGKYTKARQAIDQIIKQKPDLVFLDIKLPGADGFEILQAVMKVHQPYVIFTTAFDEYAIKAFDVNAIGYLLKPISKEKFTAALERFLTLYKANQLQSFYSGISDFLGKKPANVEFLERVIVKDPRSIQFIEVKNVMYFEAAGDYVKVVTKTAEKIINYTMMQLENELSPELFQRIHRSHIVNVKEIKEFEPHFNGEYVVNLNNGVKLKMSRNYKENLARIFKGI